MAKPSSKAKLKASAKSSVKAVSSKGPAKASGGKGKSSRPLTKSELLETISANLQFPKKEVSSVLAELVAVAYRETKKKGEFTLPGLGKFVKQKRAARKGHNPKTGAAIKIPAKTVVKFRLAKAAKDAVL